MTRTDVLESARTTALGEVVVYDDDTIGDFDAAVVDDQPLMDEVAAILRERGLRLVQDETGDYVAAEVAE